MGILRYKGYTGSVEYSEEDNCLFGKVQGLNKGTCILYEGNTVDELRTDLKKRLTGILQVAKSEALFLRNHIAVNSICE